MTNTEPQGIKDIREAKADYIESLVKLKTAEAAKEQAKADYIQAKVAYEQIMNQIAQCKADSAAAGLKVYLKEQEQALAEAEASLKAALDSIALASVTLTDAEGDAIEAYVTAYNEYVKAEKDVRAAQKTLWEATYQYAGEWTVEEYRAKLEGDIDLKESQIASKESKIAENEALWAEEHLNYDAWKEELDKYEDSLYQFEYRKNQIEKDKAYYRVEHKDDFKAFFAGIKELNKSYAKDLAPVSGFEFKEEFELPAQKVKNNGVVAKFAKYVGEVRPSGFSVNRTRTELAANFTDPDAAKKAIFGTGDAEHYSLESIITALKRDSVVVDSFIKDTAGLAEKVAAIEKKYKSTLDTLKKGIEANAAVKKAREDSTAKGAAYRAEYAKFLADQAGVYAAADSLIDALQDYHSSAKVNESEKGSVSDSTALVKAIVDFSAKKYAFFGMPDDQKDSISVLLGTNLEKDVYVPVLFDEFEKAGFAKNVTQTRWCTEVLVVVPFYAPVASYMLTPSFVSNLHETALTDAQRRQNRNAISGANPLLDAVNRALGTNFTSFQNTEIESLKFNEISNWGKVKGAKVYATNDKQSFVVNEEPYFTASLITAKEDYDKAVEKVAPAIENFYKDYYCPFWGVKYRDLTFNTKGYLEDSLVVRYTDKTFTEPYDIINFDYSDRTTPWQSGDLRFKSINVIKDSELEIVLDEIGTEQLVSGNVTRDGSINWRNFNNQDNWTLYLKNLAAQAVLADAKNYADNKEALAALEQVVEDVEEAYYDALLQIADKEAAQDSAVIAILGEDIVNANLEEGQRPYDLWKAREDNHLFVADKSNADTQEQINEVYNFCKGKSKFNLGGAQLTIANATIAKYPEVQYGWDKEENYIAVATEDLKNYIAALNKFVLKLAELDKSKGQGAENVDKLIAKIDEEYKKLIKDLNLEIGALQNEIASIENQIEKLDAGYDPQSLAIEDAQYELDKKVEALKAAETTLKIAEDAYNQVIKNHE